MIKKMRNFGDIKSKILEILTESYVNKNNNDIKKIIKFLKEDKGFKELYLFYEEVENKYIEDKVIAESYVEEICKILKEKNIGKITEGFEKVEPTKNIIYQYLDCLSEKDNLFNIDKKLMVKKSLIEHLITKKTVVESEEKFIGNQKLLHAVLVNNFNTIYDNSLNEEEKKELKDILSMSHDELNNNIIQLKETINSKVEKLLTESDNVEIKNSLERVKDELKTMEISKYNYYKLTQLKNDL